MPALNLLQILALYAAVLGLIFIALSILTIRRRRERLVSLGTGNDDNLEKRIRAHANFAEYVPLALILIAGAVLTGANAWFVHACAIALVTGRLAHAGAILTGTIRFRVYGMVATFVVIVVASVHILVGYALQL
jgi:uncharacterized protein